MIKENKIIEALQMQPLSEEEKTRRHILGRLAGPIASSNEGTRNGGRKYNRKLWEKALNDDIFKEKIASKSLFLELGHPLDREETDMTKVCACIPEMPKIFNGDLYAYVDVLDTPNGKILKTLCDYGFVPGISSRGSGEVMANNEVDPETFFLETFDIVSLPAVKKARLAMYESLDQNSMKLRKALTESLNEASDKDKKVIEEALDNLGIVLDEEDEEHYDGDFEVAITTPVEKSQEEVLSEEVEETEDEEQEETEEVEKESEESEEIEEDENAYKVKDLQKDLENFDKKATIDFAPIEVGENKILVTAMELIGSEDGTVTINFDYDSEKSDNKDDEVEKADEAVEMSVDNIRELTDDAEDNGEDETLESLKETVRQKDLLESELKTLKSEKTVSDAEVSKLQEELSKYKSAFARTSELAAKARKSDEEIKSLTEQLNQKDKEITSLKTSQQIKLDESVNKTAKTIQTLTENLKIVKNELEISENKLAEQANAYKKKLNERTEIARKYKNNYQAVLVEYVNFRASLLGVRPSDITSKLSENYTMADINKVCDKLLTENVNMPRLNIGQTSRVKINETKKANKYDDDDLSDLYDLAGLNN